MIESGSFVFASNYLSEFRNIFQLLGSPCVYGTKNNKNFVSCVRLYYYRVNGNFSRLLRIRSITQFCVQYFDLI
ncbi:hypothetical protein RIR_jg3642.t1 [Rhizophagus irregularis DAOM 181602=DAOM 197198]|nr:hypothetical protein RIR_jg3642.t1 [Rhizophagus irregularis DAOM 181602=DAOM 197198]